MNKLFSLISQCDLNPKNEVLKCLYIDAFILAFIPLVLVLKLQMVILGYVFGVLIIFDVFYFSRYGNILRSNQLNLENEFIDVFTYFGIYISNGHNVYQSLINIKPFCNEKLRGLVETLVNDIDQDKTVTPFIKFASNFYNVSIKEVLLSIYQMVDEGEGSNYIRQYEMLFSKFSEERHVLNLEKRKDTLGTLTVLPLIGSGAIMVILSISLVQIMGSYLSVL